MSMEASLTQQAIDDYMQNNPPPSLRPVGDTVFLKPLKPAELLSTAQKLAPPSARRSARLIEMEVVHTKSAFNGCKCVLM